jgi:hypothetical protein
MGTRKRLNIDKRAFCTELINQRRIAFIETILYEKLSFVKMVHCLENARLLSSVGFLKENK